MNGYILGTDAALDLDVISGNTSLTTTLVHDRWIDKLFDAFEKLGQRPGMGHSRTDLAAYPVLFWPVGAYLIIYRAEKRPIEIVAVTQGSRDIPAFLDRRMSKLV